MPRKPYLCRSALLRRIKSTLSLQQDAIQTDSVSVCAQITEKDKPATLLVIQRFIAKEASGQLARRVARYLRELFLFQKRGTQKRHITFDGRRSSFLLANAWPEAKVQVLRWPDGTTKGRRCHRRRYTGTIRLQGP